MPEHETDLKSDAWAPFLPYILLNVSWSGWLKHQYFLERALGPSHIQVGFKPLIHTYYSWRRLEAQVYYVYATLISSKVRCFSPDRYIPDSNIKR